MHESHELFLIGFNFIRSCQGMITSNNSTNLVSKNVFHGYQMKIRILGAGIIKPGTK